MTAKSAALTSGGLLLALALWLAAAGSAPAAGYDQPGYGRLRFGMTTSQVARLYPGLKPIQAGYYDLKAPLKWVGRTWQTVAVFTGGKLSGVMILTAYDPAHFSRVSAAAKKDLGAPGVFRKKLYYWRQTARMIALSWGPVGRKQMTYMRFMPLVKAAAKPAPKPGRKPATGVFRAKGEYQVCQGEAGYRYCSTRTVYGAGRTAALAVVNCNSHLTSMLAYSNIGSAKAYLTRYCRVVK
jgi:hypothetical protein